MNQNNQEQQPPTLQELFPNMRPVKSPPALFTLNGFGVSMYGKRDHDPATSTYVKTHCICLIFIPVLALGAYRVADAEKGWYFLGKVPLSKFARSWNYWMCTLVIALTAAISLNGYRSSPTYVAKQQLAEAAEVFKAGDAVKAAGIYRRVAEGTALQADGRQGLQSSLEKALQSDSASDVEKAFRILNALPARVSKPALIPDVFQRGLALVEKFKAKDSEGALSILEQVARMEPKNPTLAPLQIELLKGVVAANPNNIDRAVQLALVCETSQQMEECEKLLAPLQEKLGSTEGARILGQIFLGDGKHDDAYSLLFPYVQERLEQLRKIEKNYTAAVNSAYERALNFLQQGHAEPSFYARHKTASKADQEAMVDDYIAKSLKNDGGYQRALEEFRNANDIVNVTLELGIVQVNRAQGLSDAAARKAELEAAEKTFLAIRGLAGETDEYRLFLGQVYYWLGKSAEGKELFNQLLAANTRSHRILMSVAGTLRDVGENTQAKEMAEEAYNVAKTNEEKHAAAGFRSLMRDDIADQIAWLEKADQSAVWVQISLSGARGQKALDEGNKTGAATFLRRAVDGYANLQKSPATLNNGGLASMRLYEATGDIRDYDRGVALLEEAVSLAPGDSILCMNTANTLFSAALMQVVGEHIQVQRLGETAGFGLLSHLYADEAGRKKVFKQLQENATLRKSLVYLDKALLLAPKNTSLYELQLGVQKGFRDLPEIQKLHQRMKSASLDFTDAKENLIEVLSGKKDQEYIARFQTQIQKYESLLETDAVRGHPLTAEYARTTLNNLRQMAALYGARANPTQILEDAMALYQAHPDSATRGALSSAYFFAADDELRRTNPGYEQIARRTQRVLGGGYLIALLLENGGSLAETVRNNSHVKKAIELQVENLQRFSTPHIFEWALLKNVNGKEAAEIAASLKNDAVTAAIAAVEWDIEPLSANTVLEHYWTLKMRGEAQKAAEVYQQGIKDGLPLPQL